MEINQYSTYIPIKPVSFNEAYCPNRGRISSTYKNNAYKAAVREFFYGEWDELRKFGESVRAGKELRLRLIWWKPQNKLITKAGKISKTSGDYDNGIKGFQDSFFKVMEGYNENIDDSQITWAKIEKRVSPKNEHGITLHIMQLKL